jgi:hypothetical protein
MSHNLHKYRMKNKFIIYCTNILERTKLGKKFSTSNGNGINIKFVTSS